MAKTGYLPSNFQLCPGGEVPQEGVKPLYGAIIGGDIPPALPCDS